MQKLPDASWFEAVLASMERYPFATLALVMLALCIGLSLALASYLRRH